MTLEILSVNLDSLYLSIHGELSDFAETIIPAAKQQAQDDDDDFQMLPEIPGIPGGRFFVSRKGASRDYPYVVQNARFRINMTRRGGSRPTLTIQVKSDALYEYSLADLDVAVARIIGVLLSGATRQTVSRADIAVDFQDPKWEYPDMSDCNTRARSRMVHYEGKGITGMTFGRHQGAMQVQIYNKSETLKGDGKEWMETIWHASGNYDEQLPVQRVELRFYREILRELRNEDGSICSISDLDSSLGDLAKYAVCGKKPFFRVVDCMYRLFGLSQGHSERQEDAPWWWTIKHAFSKLDGTQGRKRISDEVRYRYADAIGRAVAALSTAAAIGRAQGWTTAVNPGQFAREAVKCYLAEEPDLWPSMVNRKTHDLRCVLGPERLEIA